MAIGECGFQPMMTQLNRPFAKMNLGLENLMVHGFLPETNAGMIKDTQDWDSFCRRGTYLCI